jgi:hypothetical protein
MQDGVTYPSTLDGSRLKIVFRSVDGDSESASKTKNEIAFSPNLRLYPNFLRFSEKKTIFGENFRKKRAISHGIRILEQFYHGIRDQGPKKTRNSKIWIKLGKQTTESTIWNQSHVWNSP